MQIVWFGVITACLLAFLFTPFTIYLARKFGFVDDPLTHSHPAIVHKGIIPRSGGVPVFLAILIASLLFLPFISKPMIGVLLGAAMIVGIGVVDDKYDVSPYVRFIVNILAAMVVVGFGVGVNFVTNPFGPGVISLTDWRITFEAFGSMHSIVVWADIIAVLWIVWMMNAINWSSGVDGQVSGIIAIAAAVLGVAAMRFLDQTGATLAVVFLAFVTAGAYAGFLPFSFYPQKIMPGYSGAALGGYLLAILAILSGARVATALIVLAVPMADGAWAVIRRLSRKQSPFRGDKEHLHHHLLARGMHKRNIAFVYWLACAILGVLALQLDSRGKLFTIIFIAVVCGGLVLWFRYISTYLKQPGPDNG